MTERDELGWQAADPATPLTTLHRIAQERPDLRPALAANPATYPALLEWLGALGDPDVDAALTARGTTPVPASGAPTTAADEGGTERSAPEQTALERPTAQAQSEAPDAAPTAAAPVEPAGDRVTGTDRPDPVTRATPDQATSGDPRREGDPSATEVFRPDPDVTATHPPTFAPTSAPPTSHAQTSAMPPAGRPQSRTREGAGTGAGHTDGAAGAPTTPGPSGGPPPVLPPRRDPLPFESPTPSSGIGAVTSTSDPTGRGPMWAVLAIVAVILIIGAVWVLNLRGDEEPAPQATTPTAEQTTEPDEPTTEPTPTTTPTAQASEQALAALTALPENSTCEDVTADAQVVEAFATAAAPDGAWVEQTSEDRLLETMSGLQDSCDAGYALELAEALVNDPDASPAVVTTLSNNTDWIELARPAPEDAQDESDFVSPSENISCVMGDDEASCTILDRDFSAPEGCDDGPVTVVVSATGRANVDCGAEEANGSGSLGYGEAAASGPFACTSETDGVTCWSTLTGRGFSVARAGVETF